MASCLGFAAFTDCVTGRMEMNKTTGNVLCAYEYVERVAAGARGMDDANGRYTSCKGKGRVIVRRAYPLFPIVSFCLPHFTDKFSKCL